MGCCLVLISIKLKHACKKLSISATNTNQQNKKKIMKHIAAYLLLVLGGNESPTADDVSKALEEVGIESDSERLNQLISELEGKDLNELMASGKEMLAKFGGGGGGGGAGGGGGDEAEEEEEEEVKEEEEEIDFSGGMDMFGGDEGGGDY